MSRPVVLGAVGLALLVGISLTCVAKSRSVNPEGWQAEFQELQASLAANYANLDWALSHHGIDPVELSRSTASRLSGARSPRRARKAVKEFLATFQDPHLYASDAKPGLMQRLDQWLEPTGTDDRTLGADLDGEAACASIGAHRTTEGWGLKWPKVQGFQPVDPEAASFRAGIVPLPQGGRLGVLRIESFGLTQYQAACVRAWEQRRATLGGSDCDDDCRVDFFWDTTKEIVVDLAERVRHLSAQGIDAMLIDITGNGGGTDWVDPAARLLSATPLHCPRSAFLRHPRNVERQQQRAQQIEEDLARQDLLDEDRATLELALSTTRGFAAAAEAACNRDTIWTSADAACPALVEQNVHSCGVLPYLPSGSLQGVDSRIAVFHPLRYEFEEGLFDGPLFVLVDGQTASASEQFIALLRHNDAAVLIGQRTAGAGCGYTGVNKPLQLDRLGLKVRVPDCVRYQSDGTNELAGIEPDIAIWNDGGDRMGALQQLLRDDPRFALGQP